MSADRQTLSVYGAEAERYLDVASGANPHLDAFLADVPAGGRVLDWGCGPGHAAAEMRARGFDVTAVDAAPEMASLAAREFGLEVTVADFGALDAVDTYDGVWASFSLLHAPRAEMPGHLAAAHRALRPGGTLSLGLKLGDGAARDRLGRFYTYYGEAEIAGLLANAGFTVTDRWTGEDRGLDGRLWPCIVLRARA